MGLQCEVPETVQVLIYWNVLPGHISHSRLACLWVNPPIVGCKLRPLPDPLLVSPTVILLHASLRLRNLKNKIENKIESIGLKRTPMGLLLEALGQEQEAGS